MNYRKITEKLNPIDDIFFRKMAESREFCEEILREFLEDSKLEVLENHAQHSITNIERRSVVLDALCKLKDGTMVNVEVQNDDNVNHQKRVRYYSSILTTSLMKKGESFENTPNICIVYVCNFDIFKAGRARYKVKRVIEECNIELDNGLREIYICANIRDESGLSKLMEVFTRDDCYSENYPVTSEMKYRLKYSEEGEKMSEALKQLYEEGIEKGMEKGMEKGIKQGIIHALISLVKDGILSITDAAERADMSVENFEKHMNGMR